MGTGPEQLNYYLVPFQRLSVEEGAFVAQIVIYKPPLFERKALY